MQLCITAEPRQGASYEDVVAFVWSAEDCGLDAFFRSDHYLATPPFGASRPAPLQNAHMTYDLRRLRLHGLIARIPNSNTYFLTPQGLRVALFYTKVHDGLLTPLLGADKPPAPLPFRRALHLIDQTVNSYVGHALIRQAA